MKTPKITIDEAHGLVIQCIKVATTSKGTVKWTTIKDKHKDLWTPLNAWANNKPQRIYSLINQMRKSQLIPQKLTPASINSLNAPTLHTLPLPASPAAPSGITTAADGRRKFTKEFKMEIVARMENGEPGVAIAKEIDVEKGRLYSWRKKFAVKSSKALVVTSSSPAPSPAPSAPAPSVLNYCPCCGVPLVGFVRAANMVSNLHSR